MGNIRELISERSTTKGPSLRDKARIRFAASGIRKTSIVSHPVFVPALTIWGALLFALCVLVAPSSSPVIKILISFIAAFIGGTSVHYAAQAFKENFESTKPQEENTISSMEGVEPINPASDLGSDSLDAPLTQSSFEEHSEATDESGHEDQMPDDGEDNVLDLDHGDTAPQELDLAEFAELPSSDSAWIDDHPTDVPVPETSEPSARSYKITKTALEKLREVPPSELSLVQMVERFAVALHEHQEAEQSQAEQIRSLDRDAALAQALKALDLFGRSGFAALDDQTGKVAGMRAEGRISSREAEQIQATTQELHSALSKLQNLRGAA